MIQQEHKKAFGIINGIDTEVWNPKTDEMLTFNFDIKNAEEGKFKNKKLLCETYDLNPDLPLFGFIGRFATEKGADLLPEIVRKGIQQMYGAFNIIVLGSGNTALEIELKNLNHTFTNFALDLGYKEHLSHQIYASADFLLMPSRVEPCGLNQMYAMRYGTIPLVRYIGGLKDTVEDISTGGCGLNFAEAKTDDVIHNMDRALHIYNQKVLLKSLIEANMKKDFSWENSAQNYVDLYQN
ncbi:glycogen synthase [Halpernia sp. GG3]